MSLYGRFEQLVTWILTLFIAVIIVIALFRLVVTNVSAACLRCVKSVKP
jgi:hypothetical protein